MTQQTELFNETILHNIRYGRWDATEAEVIAAAELGTARLISLFQDLPKGIKRLWDQMVND